MPIFPITFSIPEEKIIKELSLVKTQIISKLIPGNISTYIYDTEEAYYNEYKTSFFALTTKKAGWDCLRHYEIIANGCIPFFPNIEDCPPKTMYLLPKNLLIKANKLFYKLINVPIKELTHEHLDEYAQLLTELVAYLRNHLTTTKMASYVLERSNISEKPKHILFLSKNTYPDYCKDLILHGFKTLFGKNCHDFPKINHIYKDQNISYNQLYGKGITYTNLLSTDYYDTSMPTDDQVLTHIKNKHYDLIIYGSYNRGLPFIDLVLKNYHGSKIIFICGEDKHCGNSDTLLQQIKDTNIFVRELI